MFHRYDFFSISTAITGAMFPYLLLAWPL